MLTFTSSLLALAASLLQLPVPLGEDLRLAAMELVTRRDVAQRTVQTLVVVPRDESFHDPPGVLQRQGRLRPDAL